MSSSTTQTTINRQKLYRQTLRILNTNYLHFILISLLFIPFTFSASAAIQFYSSSGTDVTNEFDPFNLFLLKTIIANSQNLLTVKTLITVLTFTCFVILPTVAGIALITYSTNQAINRKPLTFSSTVKSLSNSYTPLLSTIIAGSIKLSLVFLLFTLSQIAVNKAIKALGFHFGQFEFSIFINSIVSIALALTILFFIVIWGSAAAISVLESKSRFEPLQQSANQSTEFRSHSFSIVYFIVFAIVPALSYSSGPPSFSWISILQVGAVYLDSSLMILLYVVANTVLYVQGKVARGEEVSGEYASVAVNDKGGEISDEVADDDVTGGFSYMMYLLIIVWVILLFFTFHKVMGKLHIWSCGLNQFSHLVPGFYFLSSVVHMTLFWSLRLKHFLSPV